MPANQKTATTQTGPDQTARFRQDVVQGLRHRPKKLDSKYFYDQNGDLLFQKIMQLPEYYLTRCELDIFQHRLPEMTSVLRAAGNAFDLIELGAGDGTKSRHLLAYLVSQRVELAYFPIDISGHILQVLSKTLHTELPQLDCRPMNGEYFEMLKKATAQSTRRKVVMLLGSTIGNMEPEQARDFCMQLRRHLNKGDLALIGFDLKKHPRTILSAYDDPTGVTAAFNLNLLSRINRELHADFNVENFEHYQTYDPLTGACKSYLVSLKNQDVHLADEHFAFEKHEAIYMEISQKFAPDDIEDLAGTSGFKVLRHIQDAKNWFTCSFWSAI